MRPDDFTNTEADAATHAAILGRSEWAGGDVGDQEANPLLDERFRCVSCEYGHHGHICRWCAGRAS